MKRTPALSVGLILVAAGVALSEQPNDGKQPARRNASGPPSQPPRGLKLWYSAPATHWMETLPLGMAGSA